MKCKQVQYFLPDYIDSGLDNEVMSEISLHLDRCDECKKEYQKYFNAMEKVKSYFEEKPLYNKSVEYKIFNNIADLKRRTLFDVLLKPVAALALAVMIVFTAVKIDYYVKKEKVRGMVENVLSLNSNVVDYIVVNNIEDINNLFIKKYTEGLLNEAEIEDALYNNIYSSLSLYLNIKLKNLSETDIKIIEDILPEYVNKYYDYVSENYEQIIL